MPSRACWKCAKRLLLDARFCPFCLADQREANPPREPDPHSPDSITLADFLRAGRLLLRDLRERGDQPLTAGTAAAARAWQETIYFLDLPGRAPRLTPIDPGIAATEAAERLAAFLDFVQESVRGLEPGGNGAAHPGEIPSVPTPR